MLWKCCTQYASLLRNLYAGQEATVTTGHGTTDWFQTRKAFQWWLPRTGGPEVESCFLYLFICNWLMIALQHWFDSCHTATWINHSSTYVPSLLHPSRLLHRLSLSSLSQRANFHWLSVYIWQCICFHATLSIHLTLSFVFPALFHKFVLSVAALWIGSSVPSFLIP